MSASVKVKVPQFDSVNKPYARYVQEIEFWQVVSKIEKKEQGVIIAYELPENDPSGIRDKLFNEVPLSDLNCDNGVANFIKYMDQIFKKDDQTQAYEDYVKFDSFRRGKGVKVQEFLMEFDKLYNMAAKRDMKLPATVLAFKLLDAAQLSKNERMFVLTGIDFSKKDTMYSQTKDALKKFTGQQVSREESCLQDIKVEPTFTASQLEDPSPELEESLANMGFYKKRKAGYNQWRNSRGRGNGGRNSRRFTRVEKPINQKNEDGEYWTCESCGSFRHMLGDCPHSYENIQARKRNGAQSKNIDVELFTEYGEQRVDAMCLLTYEAVNKGILDSGCSATVAGEEWMKSFLDTIGLEDQATVEYGKGEKWFKFGGGEVLQSIKTVVFPCMLGGTKVRLHADVVKSDIPLLISKDTMKKAGCILDLVNDRVKFFEEWVPCDVTSSGHYTVNLGSEGVTIKEVALALSGANIDTKKCILKLHRQFGHPTKNRFVSFLKDAGHWKAEYGTVIDELYDNCKTCKLFAKVPPRPVCALPVAADFGELLTMDLKECNLSNAKYILHMIDAFTRFSVSAFIKRKLPSIVVEKVMSKWVAIFGRPKKIWTDLGGEFNNTEMQEMSEAIGVELGNAAGYAPWMNGLCERNHQIIDFALEKILHDYPDINPEIGLAWADSAKNILKMNNGFSSHQLVFGKNPQLPSVYSDKLPALDGVTTSESVATHINAMYEARRAFIKSESSERIRRALRHRVRAVERPYENGQMVYYKRDTYGGHKWHGPAKVLGRDGSVVFIKHQNSFLRVAACRLQPVEEDEMKSCSSTSVSDAQPLSQSNPKKEKVQKDSNDILENGTSEEIVCGGDDPSAESGEVELDQNESDNVSVDVQKEATVTLDVQKETTVKVPKKGDLLFYKIEDDDEWKEGVVLSRAGKQSGYAGNKYWVNVQPSSAGEEASCINLQEVAGWRNMTEEGAEEVNLVLIPRQRHAEKECIDAKQKELALFEDFNVYDLVKDEGQDSISCKWVLSEKSIDGQRSVKARLVARGFEDTQDVKSDSATCSQEAFRIFLAVAVSMSWTVESTDIKSAFLRGKSLNREVFVVPPPEARHQGQLWHHKQALLHWPPGNFIK